MVTKVSPGVLQDGAYNLLSFGAKDGQDCTTAVGNWIDAVVGDEVNAYLPPGNFYLDGLVTKLWTNSVKFTMRGAGKGIANLIVSSTNSDGGLNLGTTIGSDASRNNYVVFQDFSIKTEGQGGIGLKFSQSEGGAQHKRTVTVKDLMIESSDQETDYFDEALNITGGWRPLIDNVQLSGPWINTDLTDGSLRFAGAVGLNLEGSYAPAIINTQIWSAHTAIKSHPYIGNITSFADNGSGGTRVTTSTDNPFGAGTEIYISGSAVLAYNGTWNVTRINSTQFDISVAFTATATGIAYVNNGSEGFSMTNSNLVGTRIGLDVYRISGREPNMWLSESHINYRDYGIKINGFRQINGSGLIIYNEDSGKEFSGIPYDLYCINTSELEWHHNFHHFPGNADRIFVKIEDDGSWNSGHHMRITHNQFTGDGDYAVEIDSGCTNVIVMDNMATSTAVNGSPLVSGIVNDLDGSNICQTDEEGQFMEGTWTPALTFGGGSTGLTYTGTPTGSYRIVGGIMYVKIEMTLLTKGSSTGNAGISLPATIKGPLGITANSGALNFIIYNNMTSMTSPIARPIDSTTLRLLEQTSSTTSAIDETVFMDNTSFTLHGYIVLS